MNSVVRPHRFLILAGILLGLLLLQNCSVIFPIIAPFADLPAPTGPYTVGTRNFTWIDSSRDEYFTPESDYRHLALQVWYPQDDQEGSSPYIDNPDLRIPALAKQLRLPLSIIQHIAGVSAHSTRWGPALDSEIGYPVLLFSHGLSGMRFQNTALLEEMASRGYVVIAADHSYDANISFFEDGSFAEYRAGNRRVLKGNHLEKIDLNQLSLRVGDLQFILDQLDRTIQSDYIADIPMDHQRIGLMGHSLGGTTVITALARDPRIQAVMVLDAWYIPVPDSVVSQGLHTPFLHIGQEQWADANNYARMDQVFSHSEAPLFKVLVPATMHTDFTDMPLFSPFSYYAGYTGTTNPHALLQMIRETSVIFFDTYLKHQDPTNWSAYLDSLKGVQVYSFSELKP